MKFLQKMPLYFFYTMMQKVENDQKLKSRGPALKERFLFELIFGYWLLGLNRKYEIIQEYEGRPVNPARQALYGSGCTSKFKMVFLLLKLSCSQIKSAF